MMTDTPQATDSQDNWSRVEAVWKQFFIRNIENLFAKATQRVDRSKPVENAIQKLMKS